MQFCQARTIPTECARLLAKQRSKRRAALAAERRDALVLAPHSYQRLRKSHMEGAARAGKVAHVVGMHWLGEIRSYPEPQRTESLWYQNKILSTTLSSQGHFPMPKAPLGGATAPF